MSPGAEDRLRSIPSVESLLQDEALASWLESVPRALVVECVREASEVVRRLLLAGEADAGVEGDPRRSVLRRSVELLNTHARPRYRRAVNATGIVLHTGLGRAVLAPAALSQITQEMAGYAVLQLDTETGARSRRDGRIEWLLQRLTGAQAATVVNNNAAATLLVLNSLAAGREVIVSRGQLVEIGGSFRLPDVMAASGARMVEVGTTNRTHPRDYERAITEQTAAILRVHPSNYRIEGFTSEVGLPDLVRIAHARGLALIDDVGAGALLDFTRFGFRDEPRLQDSVSAGADVITSSADKLIGGPQGGLILGRAPLVDAVRRNPLARTLRVDKVTLAALEATLTLFLDEERALREVPCLKMLGRSLEELSQQANRIAAELRRRVPGASVDVVDGFSQMGSGSLPGQDLPTRLVALASRRPNADELALAMRRHEPPVFARISGERVLIDPRTLLDGDEPIVLDAAASALAPPRP
jgi:L-seryl-tRNA(Ser) seleniumtransferase